MGVMTGHATRTSEQINVVVRQGVVLESAKSTGIDSVRALHQKYSSQSTADLPRRAATNQEVMQIRREMEKLKNEVFDAKKAGKRIKMFPPKSN